MDIYRISIPLVLGTLTAATFCKDASIAASTVTAAAIGPLVLCSTVLLWRRKNQVANILRSPPLWEAVFFLTGCLVYLIGKQLPIESGTPDFLKDAHDSLSDIIGAIPMKNEQDNALAGAIITGDRSGMDRSVTAAFRRAGAAHLLALSGMHLGIIYLAVKKLFSVMGGHPASRRIRSALIIAVTGLYTLLCGRGSSLVRAWLFILLAETGLMLDRRQDPRQVFCAALTVHLLLRPTSIMEPGFQLSYLAMAGIVFVWPYVKGWYEAAEKQAEQNKEAKEGIREEEEVTGLGQKIWEAASLCICCQLFTAPLSLLYFGTFPKFFLITNLVAAPLMSMAMACSITATALFAWLGNGIPAQVYEIMCFPLGMLRELTELVASIS